MENNGDVGIKSSQHIINKNIDFSPSQLEKAYNFVKVRTFVESNFTILDIDFEGNIK